MSILIKGMEMPRACVYRENGHLITCSLYDIDGYCEALNKEASHTEDDKLSDCPLVELPPHGRLIDADAVQKLIKNESAFAEENIGEDEHSLKLGYLCAFGTASGIVRDAPTIIEAEASHKCYHADGDCIHDNCDTCPKLCEVEDDVDTD